MRGIVPAATPRGKWQGFVVPSKLGKLFSNRQGLCSAELARHAFLKTAGAL
jgi:hypothetical protein